MLYSNGLQNRPLARRFVAGPQWREFVFRFADFGDVDGSDISAFQWGSMKVGRFELLLADVRLE